MGGSRSLVEGRKAAGRAQPGRALVLWRSLACFRASREKRCRTDLTGGDNLLDGYPRSPGTSDCHLGGRQTWPPRCSSSGEEEIGDPESVSTADGWCLLQLRKAAAKKRTGRKKRKCLLDKAADAPGQLPAGFLPASLLQGRTFPENPSSYFDFQLGPSGTFINFSPRQLPRKQRWQV